MTAGPAVVLVMWIGYAAVAGKTKKSTDARKAGEKIRRKGGRKRPQFGVLMFVDLIIQAAGEDAVGVRMRR